MNIKNFLDSENNPVPRSSGFTADHIKLKIKSINIRLFNNRDEIAAVE